jgi:hypothetical protein
MYYQKYLKYKNKYIDLQKKIGGNIYNEQAKNIAKELEKLATESGLENLYIALKADNEILINILKDFNKVHKWSVIDSKGNTKKIYGTIPYNKNVIRETTLIKNVKFVRIDEEKKLLYVDKLDNIIANMMIIDNNIYKHKDLESFYNAYKKTPQYTHIINKLSSVYENIEEAQKNSNKRC